MTFDTDLVGRWFDLLLEPHQAIGDSFTLAPTPAERQVLTEGLRVIGAAVGRSELPTPVPPPPEEPVAALLQRYLVGIATGIAGSRQAMGTMGPGTGFEGVAEIDRLSLVAGLIAGGAAVQISPDPGSTGTATEFPGAGLSARSAVDLARSAGTSAAELVVDGADLHAITSAAAATVLAEGPPDAANRNPRYRARALVGSVLMALQRSTAPAGARVRPPTCGAGPGENVGTELPAEVTFTMFLSQEVGARLAALIDGISDEVVVWSEGDRHYFHVHTRAAGEVIAEAYAVGSVFSLVIGGLD